MINTNRIVPVVDIDLLTLYNMILNAAGTTISAIAASDQDGNFTASAGNKLCNEPAKSINITAASGTVYFVARHDWEGFKINGTAADPASGTVIADGATLMSATISSGDITVAAVTPGVPA